MKLSAYLSSSRHGVYYFRFPIPRAEDTRRRTVRISLKTKCPDRAGDLARYLASCGRLVRDNKTLARLRQDQMRDMVRSYFVASLDRYTEKLNDTGLSEQSLDLLRQELAVHEDAIGGTDDLSDLYLDPDDFRASTGLTDAEWAENEPDLRRKMRKTRRDQIKALLSRAESLDGHSFAQPPKPRQRHHRPALRLWAMPALTSWQSISIGQIRWPRRRGAFLPCYWSISVKTALWLKSPETTQAS